MRRILLRPIAAALFSLLLFPGAAHAHTSVKGMGDFISGLLHPVVTPSHLLLIVGLGLLAGRKAPPAMKWPMALFIGLSAVALGLTTGWALSVHPVLLHAVSLVVGILLATGRALSLAWICPLFAFAALSMGLDSGVEPTTAGSRGQILFGTWLGLMVLVYDVSLYASLGAKARWVQIAWRIAGAWLVAISLMMLAFALRPPGGVPLP